MKKSFKRTIAVLLAVLMAMFSMPFSALAWTYSDTVPDIDFDLRFGAAFAGDADGYTDIKNYGSPSSGFTLENAGLMGPALDYNKTTGTISINQSTLAGWMNEMGEMTLDDYAGDLGDYTVGDFFTVTYIFKNIDQVAAAGAYIKYSDNITPALVFGEGTTNNNAKKAYKLGTFEDMAASTAKYKVAKTTVVDAKGMLVGQRAEDYWEDAANVSAVPYKYYENASNPNHTDSATYIGVTTTGDYLDTTGGVGVNDSTITNPSTGYADFTDENALYTATFVYKIIDEGPITFEVDLDDFTTQTQKEAALKIHNVHLSEEPVQATYVPAADGDANPGSHKVSFMGENPYATPVGPTEYTVTFKDAENGNVIDSVTGAPGTAVAAPALADYTTAPDDTNHYNASWNEAPVSQIGNEDKTYWVVNTPTAHTFGEKNYSGDYHGTTLAPATHAAAGHYTQECSACGYVLLGEEPALTAHTFGDATVTLAADGATVTENRTCTVDGTKDTSASTEIVDAATQGQAATCTAAGTKFVKAKVTYSDNYVAYSNEVEVTDPSKPATGHTYDTANIAWAWNGDYSNATATATYSCIAGDDTQSNVPATMSYVDNAQTEKRTYTAKISIDGVEYSDTKEYALPHDHSWSAEKVKMDDTEVTATCHTAGGYYKAYQCTKCGEFDDASKEWVDLGLDATNHEGPVTNVPAVAETCEEPGYTAGTYCEACQTYVTGHEEIPAKNHNYGPITFTWNAAETEATAAKVCANDASHVVNYDVLMSQETIKKATIKENGIIRYTAEVYDENGNDVIASDYRDVTVAAKGANVRVLAAAGGYVSGTVTTAVNESNVVNLPYGTSYNLTAIPAEGFKFVGWQIGSKVVSDNAKYSDVAVKNVTITPLFAEDQGDAITVIFYDMYGNVITSYNDVTPAAFQEAMANGAPEAPAYVGYTFLRYSKTDDELKALTESAQVWAQYEKNPAVTYDVTVVNGTIVSATSGEVTGGNALSGAAYDTKVTVTGEGVEAWKLNGTISGYGDTFTFYVGTDSTVEGVALTEAAKPEVNIISATALDNGIDYTLLATSSVPAGYTIKSRGFIYGKEATADELTFDNVGNATANGGGAVVKELQNKNNNVNQFALTYGLSAKTGTFRAKAYIIVNGPNGVETIMSDAYTVTYA